MAPETLNTAFIDSADALVELSGAVLFQGDSVSEVLANGGGVCECVCMCVCMEYCLRTWRGSEHASREILRVENLMYAYTHAYACACAHICERVSVCWSRMRQNCCKYGSSPTPLVSHTHIITRIAHVKANYTFTSVRRSHNVCAVNSLYMWHIQMHDMTTSYVAWVILYCYLHICEV